MPRSRKIFSSSLAEVRVERRQNPRHQFDNRHRDAERLHHARELAADHAAADDQEPLRQIGPVNRLVRRAHDRRIVRPTRNSHRRGAGGDDNFVRGHQLVAAIRRCNNHASRPVKPRVAREMGHGPALEQDWRCRREVVE